MPSPPTPSMRRRPLVMGIAAASVLAGASTAAAGGWFPVLQPRTETTLDGAPPATAGQDDDGEIAVTGDVRVRDVADAAAATVETGLPVPVVPRLPDGVAGAPAYKVVDQVTATYTPPLSEDGVNALPVRIDLGPAVGAVWSHTSGRPRLIVGRAVSPTVIAADGTTYELRDQPLSLPDLPADIEAGLRSLAEELGVPTPLMVGAMTTSMTEVNGRPATMLVSRDESFAAVAWLDHGVATFVAGFLDRDEIMAIAASLR